MPFEAEFTHAAIAVWDMEKVVDFYSSVLGFSVLWAHQDRQGEALADVTALPGAVADITMLRGHGTHIELFKYKVPRGKKRSNKRQCDLGLTHLALKVMDIEAVYAELKDKGVTFNAPPRNMRPGVFCTYMRDPEGNTIEIIQNSID